MLRVISPTVGSVGASFGSSLDFSGDRGWIGASTDHPDRIFGGAAYPLQLPKLETQKFEIDPPFFMAGASVAISNGLAVVGSPGPDQRASGGSLQIFERDQTNQWSPVSIPKRHQETIANLSYRHVSCDDGLVFSASGLELIPLSKANGQWEYGQAHPLTNTPLTLAQDGRELFWLQNGNEALIKVIDYSGTTQRTTHLKGQIASHGGAVSLADDIGLLSTSTRDAVLIFRRQNDDWVQSQKILSPPDLPGGCQFGTSLAHAGRRAIVGAPALDINREIFGAKGTALITDFDTPSSTLLTSPFPGDRPSFGWSVAISRDGNTAFIGEPCVNRGQEPGRVEQFRRDPTTGLWHHHNTLQASNAERADEFGVSLALSDDGWLIVGAKTGWVYLFEAD